jgi:hypothetical protein
VGFVEHSVGVSDVHLTAVEVENGLVAGFDAGFKAIFAISVEHFCRALLTFRLYSWKSGPSNGS